MNRQEIEDNALRNAVSGQSMANYPAIFDGFAAKGISENDIKPRENVFTFHAWKRLGRVVKKGEHGVKVVTYVEFGPGKPDPKTGELDSRKMGGRKPRSTTVFHVSQTKPLEDTAPEPVETPAPEPEPEPEPTAETPEAAEPCPHTQRLIKVGMPCVACGELA